MHSFAHASKQLFSSSASSRDAQQYLRQSPTIQCGSAPALRQRLDARAHSTLDLQQVRLLADEAVERSHPVQTTEPTPEIARQFADEELTAGCETGQKLRVAVLLSGGVDSSLALHLLKKAGHEITAFYLQIWFQEDFANFWGSCPWEDDLAVCQQVCESLGVKLEVVPLTKEYWDRVVADSISSIKQGMTPNPDIACNTRVKFGAFYDYLASSDQNFDRIASGHYARINRNNPGSVKLELTPDLVKDQTYFLSHLSQAQLSRVMFPLGTFTKAEVRQIAKECGLPNQARRDSQGICFLGKVRFDDFVARHLGTWTGPLIDEETNEVVGFHKGYWFYTPGQRKGIELSGGPWYVSRKNIRKNAVYISRQYHVPERIRNTFRCGKFTWTSGHAPLMQQLQCKVRHGPQIYNCSLLFSEDGETATVELDRNDQGLAAGQFAVFYNGLECLGAAVILPSGSEH